MIVKKKRGRPPSPATLEQRRIVDMLKNMPDYIVRLTKEEKQQAEDLFNASEINRKQILRQYKTSVIIPDEHAYAMASLGDESMEGYEGIVLEQDVEYRRLSAQYRINGAKKTQIEAKDRMRSLFFKNEFLVNRIKPNGNLTINGVAEIIAKEWGGRGVHDDAPSTRTIRNALKNYLEKA